MSLCIRRIGDGSMRLDRIAYVRGVGVVGGLLADRIGVGVVGIADEENALAPLVC